MINIGGGRYCSSTTEKIRCPEYYEASMGHGKYPCSGGDEGNPLGRWLCQFNKHICNGTGYVTRADLAEMIKIKANTLPEIVKRVEKLESEIKELKRLVEGKDADKR